jgi:transposase
MQIRSVGIDLGKTTFHLVALGDNGKVLLKKKFTQKQLIAFTANLQTTLIGLEACGGAHFLGRTLREQGHDVKLIPAQFVKPFVKSNKNDFIDAEAIAEAVDRQNMRFVPIKTDDQLDLQALHRVRDRLITRRTSVINQLRASFWSVVWYSRRARPNCASGCLRFWKTPTKISLRACGTSWPCCGTSGRISNSRWTI